MAGRGRRGTVSPRTPARRGGASAAAPGGSGDGGPWAVLSVQLMTALPLLTAACPALVVATFGWRGFGLVLAWYVQRVLRPGVYGAGGGGAFTRLLLAGWGRVVRLGALGYFPAVLVEEARLGPPPGRSSSPPPRGVLLGLHPHGLICSPLWLHVLPGGAFRARHGLEFRMATIRFNFWIPVWTDVLVALGFIVASRSSIEDNLRAGNAVGLVVGGAEEAAAMAVDRFDLVLRKRKGFIKCALRAGAPVAPVVTLGENKIIRQVLLPPGHRLGAITRALFPFCQRHLGFVPIVPYGRPFFGGLVPASVVPFQSRLVTVMGKPLPMPEISEPTQEELDHHHERYLAEVSRIYNTYKSRCGLVDSPRLRFVA